MARKKSKPTTKDPSEALVPAGTEKALPAAYTELLSELKEQIRSAQLKAAVSVNREMIRLYWDIGKVIVERQDREGWGKSVVDQLAKDLQKEFPGVSGFSPSNVWRMRSFYLAYTQQVINLAQPVREMDGENLPQPVAEIPWGHNLALIEKIKDPVQRLWYAQKTIENGWSRKVLVHQIESQLFERQGKAQTNFEKTLPSPQSDLAQEVVKDSYTFDFLMLAEDAKERELERGLLEHLKKFLIELGVGFAFVGSQYHLEVGDQDFYIDLLFYHCRLHCYVVIDLKIEAFKPEFAGKMNFYLSAVDDLLRDQDIDRPSIGLILCKEQNRVIVEYALRDTSKPMGVATYHTGAAELPKELQQSLPSVKQLEAELAKTSGN
ncbi:MAG: YhcG family protein [Gemmataceae bacterium]